MSDTLFEASTPLGISIRCTLSRWKLIESQKHPAMAGKQDDVRRAIEDPDQIRASRRDPKVHLFYRGGPSRWTCAVARVSDSGGFLITAYPTDRIKMGDTIWTRSG